MYVALVLLKIYNITAYYSCHFKSAVWYLRTVNARLSGKTR